MRGLTLAELRFSHAPTRLGPPSPVIVQTPLLGTPILMQNDVQKKAAQSISTLTSSESKSQQSSRTSCSSSPQPGPSSGPGLHSLTDCEPNERPPYSNFTLVKYAILGSPNQRLTLSGIYIAIAERYPWFQTAGTGWKNSVRHCLSLDKQFKKEPRPPAEPGKGSYWSVAVDTPRGNKRERKRNKKPTKRDMATDIARLRAKPPSSFPLTTPAFRDYATTVSVQPAPPSEVGVTRKPTHAHTRTHPPAQSGWTPYFPTAMMAAPMPMSLRGHYTEVSWSDTPGQPPQPLCDGSEEDGSDESNE